MVFNKYGVQVDRGGTLGVELECSEYFILKMGLELNFERQTAFG